MIEVGYMQGNDEIINSTESSMQAAQTALFALQAAESGNTAIRYFFIQMEIIPGEPDKRKVCYLDPLT